MQCCARQPIQPKVLRFTLCELPIYGTGVMTCCGVCFAADGSDDYEREEHATLLSGLSLHYKPIVAFVSCNLLSCQCECCLLHAQTSVCTCTWQTMKDSVVFVVRLANIRYPVQTPGMGKTIAAILCSILLNIAFTVISAPKAVHQSWKRDVIILTKALSLGVDGLQFIRHLILYSPRVRTSGPYRQLCRRMPGFQVRNRLQPACVCIHDIAPLTVALRLLPSPGHSFCPWAFTTAFAH